jgi:hypothetical protein
MTSSKVELAPDGTRWLVRLDLREAAAQEQLSQRRFHVLGPFLTQGAAQDAAFLLKRKLQGLQEAALPLAAADDQPPYQGGYTAEQERHDLQSCSLDELIALLQGFAAGSAKESSGAGGDEVGTSTAARSLPAEPQPAGGATDAPPPCQHAAASLEGCKDVVVDEELARQLQQEEEAAGRGPCSRLRRLESRAVSAGGAARARPPSRDPRLHKAALPGSWESSESSEAADEAEAMAVGVETVRRINGMFSFRPGLVAAVQGRHVRLPLCTCPTRSSAVVLRDIGILWRGLRGLDGPTAQMAHSADRRVGDACTWLHVCTVAPTLPQSPTFTVHDRCNCQEMLCGCRYEEDASLMRQLRQATDVPGLKALAIRLLDSGKLKQLARRLRGGHSPHAAAAGEAGGDAPQGRGDGRGVHAEAQSDIDAEAMPGRTRQRSAVTAMTATCVAWRNAASGHASRRPARSGSRRLRAPPMGPRMQRRWPLTRPPTCPIKPCREAALCPTCSCCSS